MNLVWIINFKVLEYDEWLNENSDELNCMFAENGADREMDFDFEKDAQKIYNDNIRENR